MLHRSPPLLLALALSCVASSAVAQEARTVPTKITAVTVYADRAQVTRTGGLDLSGTVSRVAVTKLPGWIDAESVRATLDPPTAGQILDVTVETAFLAEASEDAVKKAQAAVREIADEIGAIADEEKILNDEIARLESMRTFNIDKFPRELATRDVKVKTLGETLAFVSETLRNDRKALRALAKKRRELEPTLAARNRELADLQSRAQLQQSSVVIEAKGSGHATLLLTYLTPGAAWEPTGELRVSKGGEQVTFLQYASVIQTTGEDWTGAMLSFSTQRPGEILDVPRARGLLLDRAGPGVGDVLNKMGESFSNAQKNYFAQNEIVAKGKNHKWRDNLAQQHDIQTRAVQSFARIAQRGTTAHFAALSQRPVRADGKPVRLPIATSDFTAKLKLVSVPEVSLNAVRVADLQNAGTQAILPGKIAIFDNGAFVGNSEVGFVAPGEGFQTFLGVNDRVKLERIIDKKTSALKRRGQRTELEVAFMVTVENLGFEPVTIEIGDRIPVARDEDIEVSDVEVPKGVKPDQNGVIRWTETIPPRSKRSWRIAYTLEYSTATVTRVREEKKKMQMRMAPSSPAPAPKSLMDEIENLENNL